MWLGQFTPSQTNTLGFWFATNNRWLRGRLQTTHRRLIDVLNNEQDEMLLVSHVAPHNERFRARRESAVRAGVAVANILFCVPIEDEETPPAPRDTHAWVAKVPERVELGVGPFEIEGCLHLPEGTVLEDTLGIVRSRFLALTDVVVRRADDAAPAQRYPVVVVNGRRVDYVMPAVPSDGAAERAAASPSVAALDAAFAAVEF